MYQNDAYWNKLRGWSVLGLFALPFLVCGLGLLLQVVGRWGVWLALQTFGTQTEATITQCREDDNGDDITCLVMYEYTATGEFYLRAAREEVSPLWYLSCEAGKIISIRYLALSPDLSGIEGNTYQRNTSTVMLCWIHILGLTLAVLLLVGYKLPVTPNARRFLGTLFNGGCVTTVVTLIGWFVELAIVDTVGERQGIMGLGVGVLTGVLVAVLTWQPWRREHY